MLGGVLAVVACAYLAAVFLAADAAQQDDAELAARYRTYGIAAAAVTGIVALAGIFVLRADAPDLFDGLTRRGLPLIVLSGVGGVCSALLLARCSYRLARVATVAAVVAVVWGWAAGQYPDVLVGELTIEDAAGSRATLTAMLASLAVGGALVAPALGALLVLHSRGELEDPH